MHLAQIRRKFLLCSRVLTRMKTAHYPETTVPAASPQILAATHTASLTTSRKHWPTSARKLTIPVQDTTHYSGVAVDQAEWAVESPVSKHRWETVLCSTGMRCAESAGAYQQRVPGILRVPSCFHARFLSLLTFTLKYSVSVQG